MSMWLKQSTAIDVSVGPFVDAGDGVTPETGLTITQPDIRLKKNGGAWAQKNAAGTLSHEENGWYEIPLDTTDTNTLGNLLIAVNESGALPVWREFQVVPANVWDSFFGADKLQVHADEITAGLITAAAIATGAIDADALAADAAAEIADAVWDEPENDHVAVDTFGARVNVLATGDDVYDNVVLAITDENLPTAAENATAIATTAMTEAYSTDGGTVTLAQGIYELLARDQEISISGTTMTVKKRDGSTTAYTLTLNDADAPTSVTRSA
jgi:hypothetical protein